MAMRGGVLPEHRRDTLWRSGFPAQAGQRSQEALALAQALAHPQARRSRTSWPSTCISAAARYWRPRRRPRRY